MRQRKQKGSIHQDKGWWYVRYHVSRVVDGELRRVRIAVRVGPVTTRGKKPPFPIEEKAAQLVAAATQSDAHPERAVQLGEFYKKVYLLRITKDKKPSTVKGYRDIWERWIRPRAEKEWLSEVRCVHVQGWMDSIADFDNVPHRNKQPRRLGRNTLRNIKSFLSALFKLAKQQGFYTGENPVRDTGVSTTAIEPKETYAYSLDEIQAFLSVVPERAGVVIATAGYAGLRRGELAGTLWENYHDDDLHVSQSVWEGRATLPKTERSKAAVPVIRQLGLRLDQWRLRCGNPATGPMFRGVTGKPASMNNILRREILPFINRCRHCHKSQDGHRRIEHEFERDESIPQWYGWNAFRRGLASNLHQLDVPDDVIQRILRHGDADTTRKHYIKTRDKQVQQAMAKLEKALPARAAVQ